MPHFTHGEVEIAYLDEGEGEPIVLVHGFASNKEAPVPRQRPTFADRNRPVMRAKIKQVSQGVCVIAGHLETC